MKQLGCALLLLLVGCASLSSTEDIPSVTNFNPTLFMGDWYEIARLPDVFETNLEDVKFNYLQEGRVVRLTKSGVCEDRDRFLFSKGRFERELNVGEFRLEFLDDFGELHRVIWVSPKYDRAIVTSDRFCDLWILSRDRVVPKAELDKLVEKVKTWGFETEELEYTKQK